MAFLPEWTWYNILIVAYFGVTGPLVFLGQTKADQGAAVWSKFAIGRDHRCGMSATAGFLMKYAPAFILIASKPLWVELGGSVPGLLEGMMLLHFGKRILEVLCLHDFSGSPVEDGISSTLIGTFYAVNAWLYARDGARAEGPLLYVGIACFCLALLGNFYHHLLLKRLRSTGSEGAVPGGAAPAAEGEGVAMQPQSKYKIPMGGLFGLVTCPHYFFEILGFWSVALTALRLIPVCLAWNTTCLLAGHAMSTTQWYKEKFGDQWPQERKHLIPFLF